jgi:hypothetical protein
MSDDPSEDLRDVSFVEALEARLESECIDRWLSRCQLYHRSHR